jgi:hypothetical protein
VDRSIQWNVPGTSFKSKFGSIGVNPEWVDRRRYRILDPFVYPVCKSDRGIGTKEDLWRRIGRLQDAVSFELMAEERMAVAGAQAEPEILEDLSYAPGLSLCVNGFQWECDTFFVLGRSGCRK